MTEQETRPDALLVFATGGDRPGIVDRLSGLIFEAGCNLEDSRMALLGGEFALIALVTGVRQSLARLEEGLPAVARDLDLSVQTKPTSPRREAPGRGIVYHLRAVALDHPGIVHKLARRLSARGVNVVGLETSVSYAPVCGAPVFSLAIEAEVPLDLSVSELRAELNELAAEDNIDLEMRAAGKG
jgi:glycine cleavage system transcriptional repressor